MAETCPFDAVLLIAFGGPSAPEEVRPFLANVARGRPIPPERLEEVAHHYERIGGKSPLTELTFRQARALEQELARRAGSGQQAVGSGQAEEGLGAGGWGLGTSVRPVRHWPLATDHWPLPVYVGMRNWHPFLAETIRQMARDGVRRAIGFIMAAYRSDASWERYQRDVAEACRQVGGPVPEFAYIEPFYKHPAFIEAVAEQVRRAWVQLAMGGGETPVSGGRNTGKGTSNTQPQALLDKPAVAPARSTGETPVPPGPIEEHRRDAGATQWMPQDGQGTPATQPQALPGKPAVAPTPSTGETPVPPEVVMPAEVPLVFTAHSIPLSMAETSPYAAQLTEACRLVAERLGHSNWRLAYQSRSGSPQVPWLEPDILDVLRELAAKGTRAVIVQPIGFLCDHVEVLYDLDVEARELAGELGITMVRAGTVNDDPRFIGMMAEVVEAMLNGQESESASQRVSESGC